MIVLCINLGRKKADEEKVNAAPVYHPKDTDKQFAAGNEVTAAYNKWSTKDYRWSMA